MTPASLHSGADAAARVAAIPTAATARTVPPSAARNAAITKVPVSGSESVSAWAAINPARRARPSNGAVRRSSDIDRNLDQWSPLGRTSEDVRLAAVGGGDNRGARI